MALFVAGKSGNEQGRPRSSVRSVKGMVERFVRRNITPTKLSKIFEKLTESQKADFLLQLLPYTIAKQSPEGINQEEIDRLYNMVQDALKEKNGQQAV